MNLQKPIYLDYNATTPNHPEVITAMLPFLEEHFGNPSSSHYYGVQPKKAIENARNQIASLLNCESSEIIFTSGGTESNNYAIKGTAFANQNTGNHIITTQIEHPAVLEVCKFLENHNFIVTYLPVDEFGMLNISDVEKAITTKTILITVMHANNEVGTIQPISDISKLAKQHGIIFHTDAAQSVGKMPTDIKTLGVDLLSIAGHKLYAPKGIGALYVRKGVELSKFMHGASQEQGKRAGTENVMQIVGLGKACEIAKRDMKENIFHMKKMRDRLYDGLRKTFNNIKLNGHPDMRLPNTLSLSFVNIDTNMLLSEIKEYVAASAGSACHSGSKEISHILKAMNISFETAKGTVRFSTGKMTTENEIDIAIDIITNAIKK